MKQLTRAILGIIVVAVLSSCAHLPMSNGNYVGPKALPPEIKEYYSYPKSQLKYTTTLIEEGERYLVKRIELIVPPEADFFKDGDNKIIIDYYDIPGDAKVPVILVLPILGGDRDVSDFFAKSFAKQGFAVLIVRQNKRRQKNINFDNFETSFRQIVVEQKLAIDWLETQSDLDAQRIGVFGISMGGIKSALVVALDDRIKVAVSALSGCNIPYIIFHSEEAGIKKQVNRALIEKNDDPFRVYDDLYRSLKTDPLTYAEYIDARKILVILAVFDNIVPFGQGRELIKRIGYPERIYIVSGHYTAALYAYYINAETIIFFKNRL